MLHSNHSSSANTTFKGKTLAPFTRFSTHSFYDQGGVPSSGQAQAGLGFSGQVRVADMRILIVDDESVIADSLALIFRASGFEARCVYSGEHALEIAPSFEPDVLISDVVMRGVTGIEVAIYVREHFPACRVLLFSGQAATSDLIQAANTKGYHFDILTKPVRPQVLLDYLQDCANRLEPKHAGTRG